MLPTTAVLVLASLLGVGNAELIGVLAFCAGCGFVLLVHAGLFHVLRLSSSRAFFLAPLVLRALGDSVPLGL